MSQQYRRIPLDEFLRQAATILDGVAARGETVLIEHKGKFFSVGAYSAYRRRAPAKPQPPNMQDSLWSYARSSALEAGMNGERPATVAEESDESSHERIASRNGSEPSSKQLE